MSLAASVILMLNLWGAGRGQYRWYVDGLVSALIWLILSAILLPTIVVDDALHPAAYAKLGGRDLRGAYLGYYSFAFADLRHVNLAGAHLGYSSFWGADLTGASLAGAKLNHARLWHARATGANLTGADMQDAVLRTAIFHGAQLHDADLRNARLNDLGRQVPARDGGGADLRNADLTGADLRGASLQGAILTGARYDARTRWPAGFDPLKHGAQLTKTRAFGRNTIPI